MASEGLRDFPELVARSIDEPEWFWDAVVRFLGVRFSKPYERVLDTSDGIAWAKWFTGGELNIAETCLDRWADDPATADQIAVIVFFFNDTATTEIYTLSLHDALPI